MGQKRKAAAAALLSLIFTAVAVGPAPAAYAADKTVAKASTSKKKRPIYRGEAMLPAQQALVSSIVILMNEDGTFRVMNEDQAHARRTPASITKLMTLSLLFDALDSGELNLKDKIKISATDTGAGGTLLPVPAGSTISVQEAIMAMITKSANNVAVSVAEHLAGTEPAFVEKMNAEARRLGMRNTNFVNSHGMRHPDQYSSAYDLAVLSNHLINQHSEYYHYFSSLSFIYKKATYNNHNRLMRVYGGMDGLKTGMTNHGWQLAASAERVIEADPEAKTPEKVHRLIGVFLGGQTKGQRNNCLGHLLDQAFMELGHDDLPENRFVYSKKACTSDRNP
ncbi:MAG: D-alanyl-D-alanine carboxypeptidase family protein [Micavibrio sp.]